MPSLRGTVARATRGAGRFKAPLYRAARAAAAAVVAACSLSSNVDRFDNGACPDGTKACTESCISVTEPRVGCKSRGCMPCDLPNAVAVCSPNGTCAVGPCIGSYADCNQEASDGCEADVDHDPVNCGGCGCQCGSGVSTHCASGQDVGPIAHGAAGCSAGQCVVGSCDPGWGDCNGLATDGCETSTKTDDDCGTCGTVCSPPEHCQCELLGGQTGCLCGSSDGGSPESGAD
jgi:hypothetical protein